MAWFVYSFLSVDLCLFLPQNIHTKLSVSLFLSPPLSLLIFLYLSSSLSLSIALYLSHSSFLSFLISIDLYPSRSLPLSVFFSYLLRSIFFIAFSAPLSPLETQIEIQNKLYHFRPPRLLFSNT